MDAAFGCLVCKRGELGSVGELRGTDAGGGQERGGLPVAKGNGARLVQQQDVDVSGGFDRPAGHGDDVSCDHAAHARHADRGKQPADGGRDEAHEQCDERRDETAVPAFDVSTAYTENGSSVTQASRNTSVIATSRMVRAISLGVFWRFAPSTI